MTSGVIASVTKQSRSLLLDCFAYAAYARNDGPFTGLLRIRPRQRVLLFILAEAVALGAFLVMRLAAAVPYDNIIQGAHS